MHSTPYQYSRDLLRQLSVSSYEGRRVYKHDLFECPPAETPNRVRKDAAKSFSRQTSHCYPSPARVETGIDRPIGIMQE